MQTGMNEKAQTLLNALNNVSPTNIGQTTTAPVAVRDAFHSMWFNHSPQAARYMLLPYLYNDKVLFTE